MADPGDRREVSSQDPRKPAQAADRGVAREFWVNPFEVAGGPIEVLGVIPARGEAATAPRRNPPVRHPLLGIGTRAGRWPCEPAACGALRSEGPLPYIHPAAERAFCRVPLSV